MLIIGPLHEYARIGGHVVDGSNFVVYTGRAIVKPGIFVNII